MRCCRSTPTALDLVVSPVSQPAANAAVTRRKITTLRFMTASNVYPSPQVDNLQPYTFQGIGKKEACQGRARRKAERDPRAGHLPGPAREQDSHSAAGTIAQA